MDKVFIMLTLIVLVVALTVEHNARKDKALAQRGTLITEKYTHKCAYKNADFSDIKNSNVTFSSKNCR